LLSLSLPPTSFSLVRSQAFAQRSLFFFWVSCLQKVNGPEILNKYVGQSEENIRALFKDAEDDQVRHNAMILPIS
jgi:SpoVK/Ycf46/Vps4 family AAA+-type ATPase